MTPAERADAYLTIAPSYAAALGGLQWAHRCDAIERADGTTLALTEELTQFLEGLFAGEARVPFAFALSLLQIMKETMPLVAEHPRESAPVKGATSVVRNAGVFSATLCSGVPLAAAAPSWAEVSTALARRQQSGLHNRPGLVEEPPLSPDVFAAQIRGKLAQVGLAALAHWLKFGTPPSGAGKQLAEPVDTLAARMAKLHVLARKRPRLVGALALAPALDAALTLPPRKRPPDSLPQGGYADVTTRGEPERLLPGQFALDPDEFVRRFASHELLYFKREEPHAPERPRRVLVLDQGVRTWGSVRLALAGAALALIAKEPKRAGPVQLVVTSSNDPDVATLDLPVLAERLEASDLSPHPADGLWRVLKSEGTELRDVILLTHPRNVAEPDVVFAARERRPTDRLFTLAVDDHGRAELAEWTDGGPVPVRKFRVDLAAAEAAKPEEEPKPTPPSPVRWAGLWTGDVEPVPFAFRPGMVSESTLLGFDAEGEWVVTCGTYGVPQALALDGSPPEVLPRAYQDGHVLRTVEAVLGVAGGVVVCGRMNEGFAAAHYDRVSRKVTLHLGNATEGARWFAYPDLHCVAVHRSDPNAWNVGGAVDLASGGQYPGTDTGVDRSRAQKAWSRVQAGRTESRILRVVTQWSPEELLANEPVLYLWGNAVEIRRANPAWQRFEPTREGKPLLAGASIHKAELTGDVLALTLHWPDRRRLMFFRGPDGALIRDYEFDRMAAPALSRDGTRVAYRRGRVLKVENLAGESLAMVGTARLHNRVDVQIREAQRWLVIRVGSHVNVFDWGSGMLSHHHRVVADPLPMTNPYINLKPVAYDTMRFPPVVHGCTPSLRAVIDRVGQVLLYSKDRLVLAIVVSRYRAAAWMPDGTFWGDAQLIGGAAAPDAANKIAQALTAEN